MVTLWLIQAAGAIPPALDAGPFGVALRLSPDDSARLAVAPAAPGDTVEVWLEVVCPEGPPAEPGVLTLRTVGAVPLVRQPRHGLSSEVEPEAVVVPLDLGELCVEPTTAVLPLAFEVRGAGGFLIEATLERDARARWTSEAQLTVAPTPGEAGWAPQRYWTWLDDLESHLAALAEPLAEVGIDPSPVAFDPQRYGLPPEVFSDRVRVEAGKAWLEAP